MILFFIEKKRASAKGNRFAQCIHDDGTLDSGDNYQAFALQATDTSWGKNIVVCVAFAHFSDGGHELVAANLEQVFVKRCGFNVKEIAGSIISDVAASGVPDRFHEHKEKCNMHQMGRLAESAVGDFTRSKGMQVVNPFKEGQQCMRFVMDCADYFNSSKDNE